MEKQLIEIAILIIKFQNLFLYIFITLLNIINVIIFVAEFRDYNNIKLILNNKENYISFLKIFKYDFSSQNSEDKIFFNIEFWKKSGCCTNEKNYDQI